MSSTNVGKNPYRSISFVLTLEQNMVTTTTSFQVLVPNIMDYCKANQLLNYILTLSTIQA